MAHTALLFVAPLLGFILLVQALDWMLPKKSKSSIQVAAITAWNWLDDQRRGYSPTLLFFGPMLPVLAAVMFVARFVVATGSLLSPELRYEPVFASDPQEAALVSLVVLAAFLVTSAMSFFVLHLGVISRLRAAFDLREFWQVFGGEVLRHGWSLPLCALILLAWAWAPVVAPFLLPFLMLLILHLAETAMLLWTAPILIAWNVTVLLIMGLLASVEFLIRRAIEQPRKLLELVRGLVELIKIGF